MPKPICHNRPPRPAHTWVRAGYCKRTLKPRLRPVPASPTRDECKAYDAPDGSTPAPILTRWDCTGCRWLPANARSTS